MSTPILKKLEIDPTANLNMAQYETTLTGTAKHYWDYYLTNTPTWWVEQDLPTVERFCVLLGAAADVAEDLNNTNLRNDVDLYNNRLKMYKTISLELKSVEYALGATPQARAALKLSVSASAAAYEQAEQARAQYERTNSNPKEGVIPVEELMRSA